MPPKRNTRASAKAPADAPTPKRGGFNAFMNEGTPLPAQHSTSYGSASRLGSASSTPSKHGANTNAAVGSLIQATRRDNRQARRARQDAADRGVRVAIPVEEEEDSTLQEVAEEVEKDQEEEEEDGEQPSQRQQLRQPALSRAEKKRAEGEAERRQQARLKELFELEAEKKREEAARREVEKRQQEEYRLRKEKEDREKEKEKEDRGKREDKAREAQEAERRRRSLVSASVPGTSQSARSFGQESLIFDDATLRTSPTGSSPFSAHRPTESIRATLQPVPQLSRPIFGALSRLGVFSTSSPGERSGLLPATVEEVEDEGERQHDEDEETVDVIESASRFSRRRDGSSPFRHPALDVETEGLEDGPARMAVAERRVPAYTPAPAGAQYQQTPSHSLREYLKRLLIPTAALLVAILLFNAIAFYTNPPDIFNTGRPSSNMHWYGWGPSSMAKNVAQLLPPLMPRFGPMTDHERAILDNRMEWTKDRADKAHSRIDAQIGKLDHLESLLPSHIVVKMDKNGNLVPKPDFWHALLGLMQQDDMVFTFERDSRGRLTIPDHYLKALTSELERAGIAKQNGRAANTTALSPMQVEDIAQRALPRLWNTWLNDNMKQVKDVIKTAVPDYMGAQLEGAVHRAFEQRQDLQGSPGQTAVVSREEFLRIANEAIATHSDKVDAQFKQQDAKLAAFKKELQFAIDNRHAGLAKSEARAIAEQAVNDKIKQLKAELIAKNAIGAHFEDELSQQVNFFSLGSGAAVHAHQTSRTYVMQKAPPKSSEWQKRIQRILPQKRDPIDALKTWDEAGDCWCAGILNKTEGTMPADLAVDLSRRIIPEHIVIENVAPTATLEPKTMPKEIEVWIKLEFDDVRRNADAFASKTFDRDVWDQDPKYRGMHLVAKFKYEYDKMTRGVMVHRLSDELKEIKAYTDLVLVRAVTNHGARDRTCFYRVRLYGEVQPGSGV
jgi:hypothetical protein